MRWQSAVALLFVVMLMPKEGRAQVYQFQTPPPEVTAAAAEWQINALPIMVQGLVYYPTDSTRPFDGNVMMQTGVFNNVPVYADATLEPFSQVLVPIGRGRMRVYERRREGALAGTTGSRTPTFPVQPVSGIPSGPRVVSTGGVETSGTTGMTGTAAAPAAASASESSRPTPTRMESIPRPRVTDGVWIQYDGAKWYSHGEAVTYSADRFAQIGTYHGFPVYRERNAATREIWVAVMPDGPVAPYAKR